MKNGGETITIHEEKRRPIFSGGHNFRDLGGYPAAGGKTTAWGKIFRSGTLACLSPSAVDYLTTIEVKLICDLRSNSERQSNPSKLLKHDQIEIWSHDNTVSSADLANKLQQMDVTAETACAYMTKSYQALPYDQRAACRTIFSRIAIADFPLIFHCTLGKDRTGVIAALLLDILGVERDVVMADYLMTNDFLEGALGIIKKNVSHERMTSLPEDLWQPVIRADRQYLEAMFDVIESRHGSAEQYMVDILKLDHDQINAIRSQLLT